MNITTLDYALHDTTFESYLAYNDSGNFPKPAVLVFHDWSGCNDFAKEKARQLADLGYVGFAVDLYGHGKIGQNNDEKAKLMAPLVENRELLLARLKTAYDVCKALEVVDASRIATIGFCFGGLCALDLARSGTDIKGAVSFHGALGKPNDNMVKKIKSKILVLHGYDDPMVPPSQVENFASEMTEAQADWQIHMYGHTLHAFTNPNANDPNFGTVYNATADQRSWLAMKNFLAEIF